MVVAGQASASRQLAAPARGMCLPDEIFLGARSSCFLGEWDAASAYVAGNQVTFRDSLWANVQSCTNQPPNLNFSHWALISTGLSAARLAFSQRPAAPSSSPTTLEDGELATEERTVGDTQTSTIMSGQTVSTGRLEVDGMVVFDVPSTNTCVGKDACAQQRVSSGTSSAVASNCTAVGLLALYANTGANNTAVGALSLQSNTVGTGNTAVGEAAAGGTTTANRVTAVGQQALQSNNADDTTAVGYQAGLSSTGSLAKQCTYLGSMTGNSGNTVNATAIGYGAQVSASNMIQLGNGSITSVVLGNTTTTNTSTGSIMLATSGGGVPTMLNYYEEYSWPTTLTGGGQTVSLVIPFVRVGKLVTATIPGFATSGALSTGAILISGAIPVRFLRPSYYPYQFMMVQTGSTTTVGNLGLYNPGTGTAFVFCYGNINGQQFPGGATVGFFPNSISWTLN